MFVQKEKKNTFFGKITQKIKRHLSLSDHTEF